MPGLLMSFTLCNFVFKPTQVKNIILFTVISIFIFSDTYYLISVFAS